MRHAALGLILWLGALASAPALADPPANLGLPPAADASGVQPLVVPAAPVAEAERETRASQDRSLDEWVALRFEPTRLSAPSEPGMRHGNADVSLSLPLAGPIDLRTGVRLDYESHPASGDWDVDSTPTVGVGVRF